MNTDIYQKAILEHAHSKFKEGRLDYPTTSATVDNPLCGDRVTIDLNLESGRIIEIAQHTRGCILCKAASSIVAKRAIGQDAATLREVGANFTEMLKGEGSTPGDRWKDLEVFTPVIPHISRHHCVLLPFEALNNALPEDSR